MANIGAFGAAKKEAKRHINPNAEPDTLTYFDEKIRIADEVGMAPLMDFAAAAVEGVDSTDMAGLAAIKSMLQDCIHEDDWPKFWALSKKNKADAELLMEIVQAVMEVITGRPTERPSDSSYGQSQSSPPVSESLPASASLSPVTATVGVG